MKHIKHYPIFEGDESVLSRDPATQPETLARLARIEGDDYIRYHVAGNPSTPAETLTWLAGDENSMVRQEVADNRRTPAETLVQLSGDEDWAVRWRVAGNPSTPAETLTLLAGDENLWVRRGVAKNSSAQIETLLQLARDGDAQASRSALETMPEEKRAKALRLKQLGLL